MMNMFGTAQSHYEVNKVMDGVIANMESLGATLVRFELGEYDTLAPVVATSQFEARTMMERYFSSLGPNARIKSFAELVAARTSVVQKTLESELAALGRPGCAKLSLATSHKPWRRRRPSALPAQSRSGGQS
jgi:hypothetical protein